MFKSDSDSELHQISKCTIARGGAVCTVHKGKASNFKFKLKVGCSKLEAAAGGAATRMLLVSTRLPW